MDDPAHAPVAPTVRAPLIHIQRADTARCPDCGQLTLDRVTAHLDLAPGTPQRVIGGWALCTSCHATPHPVMGVPDGGS